MILGEMKRLTTLLIILGLGATSAAAATTVGGIRYEDSMAVDGVGLVLNGAGVRTRVFFKVYAIGLYVARRHTDAAALLTDKGSKRIRIVPLRDVDAQTFADGLVEGIERNHSAAAMSALKPGIDALHHTLLGLKEAKKGFVFHLDYVSGGGVRLLVNDEQKGTGIGGGELYAALLRIWIGDRPAQQDLKEALLGKNQQ